MKFITAVLILLSFSLQAQIDPEKEAYINGMISGMEEMERKEAEELYEMGLKIVAYRATEKKVKDLRKLRKERNLTNAEKLELYNSLKKLRQ